MTNEWIVEVLTDLRAFALENGLAALASELDNTVAVACRELNAGAEDRGGGARRDGRKDRWRG